MKIIIKNGKLKVDEIILINYTLVEAKYHANKVAKRYEKPFKVILKC